ATSTADTAGTILASLCCSCSYSRRTRSSSATFLFFVCRLSRTCTPSSRNWIHHTSPRWNNVATQAPTLATTPANSAYLSTKRAQSSFRGPRGRAVRTLFVTEYVTKSVLIGPGGDPSIRQTRIPASDARTGGAAAAGAQVGGCLINNPFGRFLSVPCSKNQAKSIGRANYSGRIAEERLCETNLANQSLVIWNPDAEESRGRHTCLDLVEETIANEQFIRRKDGAAWKVQVRLGLHKQHCRGCPDRL